jgi:hypothetical protein
MGAAGSTLSCPSGFIPSPSGLTCVLPCPEAKNYEMTSVGTALFCKHKGDARVKVPLTPVPMYMAGGQGQPVINANPSTLPNNQVYIAEINRFNNAMAVADANIDKEVKVKTAFSALQAAENARDSAPDAYQQARIAYYTLIKGDTWINDEKTRIGSVEAEPVIKNYLSNYSELAQQINTHKSTIETVNGIKDKVLTVKDDLQYSVSAFQRQLDAIRNQMNINKKKQIETVQQTTSTIDTLLNWLMIIGTFLAIFFAVRYLMRKSLNTNSSVQSSSSDYDNFFRNYALVVPRAPPGRV